MNELRLIKIYEIRGKIHPIEAFVIDLLDGIETRVSSDQHYKYYTDYDKNDKNFFTIFDDDSLLLNTTYSNNIKIKFNVYDIEVYDIFKYLLKKHMNLDLKCWYE